jgi:hypothetical protein
MDVYQRLYQTILAVCPIEGVSVPTVGNSATVRIDYQPSATAAQQAAAQAALASFDWSTTAQAAWELAQNQAAAVPQLEATDQVTIGVRALAYQCLQVINANAAAIAELQTLAKAAGWNVTQPTPAQLTSAQAKAAIAAIISSGQANS